MGSDSKAMPYLGQVLIDGCFTADNQATLDYTKVNVMVAKENEILAAKIREAIKASELSKTQIANEIQVSKQSITGWEESGRISKPNLMKLAALLQIDVSHFLTGSVV